MTEKTNVLKVMIETFAMMGQEQTDDVLQLLLMRLQSYKEADIIIALRKCQTQCRRVYLVDILNRLPRPPLPPGGSYYT